MSSSVLCHPMDEAHHSGLVRSSVYRDNTFTNTHASMSLVSEPKRTDLEPHTRAVNATMDAIVWRISRADRPDRLHGR